MTNKYDNKHPINTVLSVDPAKKSFDFQMNYDLGKTLSIVFMGTHTFIISN